MPNFYDKLPYDPNVIRTLRKRRGWTQGDLADKIGVTRQTIYGIERGSSTSIKTHQKLCELFGVERLDQLPERDATQYDVAAALKDVYRHVGDPEMHCMVDGRELSDTTRREIMTKLSETMMLCVL